MRGFSTYIVSSNAPDLRTGAFSIDAGADSLPVTGVIESPAKGWPGAKGDEIWFQYNAVVEEDWEFGDYRLIPPDMVYSVAGQMINQWVFFELTEELDNGARMGVITNSSTYPIGTEIIAARGLSHRVLPKIFYDRDLYAVKSKYILFYKR